MNTLHLAASTPDTFGIPTGIWNLSPWGIVGGLIIILFILVATGRWIPRSSHERELAQANKRGDEWKETALEGRALIKEQSQQIGKFAEASKTPAEFFGTVMRTGGASSAPPQQETPQS